MIAVSNKQLDKPLPRSVRCAVDAMHANIGHAWTVGELAAVAGVSSRTLQRQFLAFLGKPPGAKLRDINFEHARRELLQGSVGAKVMDIALRSGFPLRRDAVPDAEAASRVRRGARSNAIFFCAVSQRTDGCH
jgi:AraC-like DNA-binding protein